MAVLERNTLGDIKNSLVAVFSKDANLDDLLESLGDLGLQEDTNVIRHDEETSLDDPNNQGLLKAIRHAFSDKSVEVEESLTNALRMGKQVVQTYLAEDSTAQEQVRQLYLDSGGEFLHYFGEWSIEVIKDNVPVYSRND